MTVSLFLPVYSQTLLFSHFVRFNIFPHVVRSLSPLGQSFFYQLPLLLASRPIPGPSDPTPNPCRMLGVQQLLRPPPSRAAANIHGDRGRLG